MDTDFVVYGKKDCLNLELTLAIGAWKQRKPITVPTQFYTYKFNEVTENSKVSNINIEVEDEWDTRPICQQIVKRSSCLGSEVVTQNNMPPLARGILSSQHLKPQPEPDLQSASCKARHRPSSHRPSSHRPSHTGHHHTCRHHTGHHYTDRHYTCHDHACHHHTCIITHSIITHSIIGQAIIAVFAVRTLDTCKKTSNIRASCVIDTTMAVPSSERDLRA